MGKCDIVAREKNCFKRKIIEASFIAADGRSVSQASKEVSDSWLKNIKKYVNTFIRV